MLVSVHGCVSACLLESGQIFVEQNWIGWLQYHSIFWVRDGPSHLSSSSLPCISFPSRFFHNPKGAWAVIQVPFGIEPTLITLIPSWWSPSNPQKIWALLSKRTKCQFPFSFQRAANKNVLQRAKADRRTWSTLESFCSRPPYILEAPAGMWPEFKHSGHDH